MAFKEPTYEYTPPAEQETQTDVYKEGQEPFVPGTIEGFVTPEQIVAASGGASENGFSTQKQIDDLREALIKNQFVSPEKITEVTGGLSEKGFATPEQMNAVTTMALDQASNSMEVTGRSNATLAMQEAEDKLQDAKKSSGLTKMMNWVRGRGSEKRQNSQSRFNKVN